MTDRTERSSKERNLEGLAVVIGCLEPLRDVYRDSVDEDVNAKAIVTWPRSGFGLVMNRRTHQDLARRFPSVASRHFPTECDAHRHRQYILTT